MDDGGPTASYIVFFVLLLVDVLFYGFNAALQQLNAKEIADQSEADQKNKRAKRLYQIIENPRQYSDTLQLTVTLINLIMGSLFLGSFGDVLSRVLVEGCLLPKVPFIVAAGAAYFLAGAALLYILLIFGVLIPGRLGARYGNAWANACVNPIFFITKLLSPVTWLAAAVAKGTLRLFGIHPDENTEDVTQEEIISMVNEGHEQGVLLATEAEMITNIFEFGDKEASDIMTNRKNILAIDRNMTLTDALDYMLSESKSRFPVYQDDIDNIAGILHFRDAMRFYRDERNMTLPVGDIQGLVREAMFVPETKNIDVLFRTMQHTKTQMVIVVDEYGQTSGLVAMEDILEEIVGNIMDEYDEEEEYIEETENADQYIIDGITPLEELEERFGISFQEQEFETLNGFLISKLDRLPEEDEDFSIDVDGYNFKIQSVERMMIKSVLVTKNPEKPRERAEEETENKQE